MVPPDDERVTLAVLGAKVDNISSTLNEVRADMRTMREQALDRRVTAVEENIKWIVRSLVVAVLGAGATIVTSLIR